VSLSVSIIMNRSCRAIDFDQKRHRVRARRSRLSVKLEVEALNNVVGISSEILVDVLHGVFNVFLLRKKLLLHNFADVFDLDSFHLSGDLVCLGTQTLHVLPFVVTHLLNTLPVRVARDVDIDWLVLDTRAVRISFLLHKIRAVLHRAKRASSHSSPVVADEVSGGILAQLDVFAMRFVRLSLASKVLLQIFVALGWHLPH